MVFCDMGSRDPKIEQLKNAIEQAEKDGDYRKAEELTRELLWQDYRS